LPVRAARRRGRCPEPPSAAKIGPNVDPMRIDDDPDVAPSCAALPDTITKRKEALDRAL